MDFDKQTIAVTTNSFSPMAIEKKTLRKWRKTRRIPPLSSAGKEGERKKFSGFFFSAFPHSPFPQDTATFFTPSSSSFGFLASSFVGRWGGGKARSPLFESRRLRRCGRSGLPFLIRLSMRGQESERGVVVVCTDTCE